MSEQIYLDYNASTPVEADVVDKMIPFFLKQYGNPSNQSHQFGWAADEAANMAREQLASLIGATPDEIVFTSGASEAVNTAIKGVAKAYANQGKHIITCATEHKAVLASCESLQTDGFEITYLPVDDSGQICPDDLKSALRSDTILVALMWANNETGVLHPMDTITKILADHPALLLSDATQAVGKIPVSVDGIDLLACSAHKFYGPKGVGALYIRKSSPPLRCIPLIHGGAHEHGLRAGTINVPGIVGLGAAAEICEPRMAADRKRLAELRDNFEAALKARVPGVIINGESAERLPQTSNVTFPVSNASIMMSTIGIAAVSSGSSCSTGEGKPSHVLVAHGLSMEQSNGTIRFSMGRTTTKEDMDRVVNDIVKYCDSFVKFNAVLQVSNQT